MFGSILMLSVIKSMIPQLIALVKSVEAATGETVVGVLLACCMCFNLVASLALLLGLHKVPNTSVRSCCKVHLVLLGLACFTPAAQAVQDGALRLPDVQIASRSHTMAHPSGAAPGANMLVSSSTSRTRRLSSAQTSRITGWSVRNSGLHVSRGGKAASILGAVGDCSASKCKAAASVLPATPRVTAAQAAPSPGWQAPAGCTITPRPAGCVHSQPKGTSFVGHTQDLARALEFTDMLNGALYLPSVDASVNFRRNEQVVLADFDGDGYLDLLSKRSENPGMWNYVHYNDGTGNFCGSSTSCAYAQKFAAGVEFDGAYNLVGDVDGDGKIDVISNQWFYRNMGSTNPGGLLVSTAQLTSATDKHAITMADVDGDGTLEVYITGNEHSSTGEIVKYDPNWFDEGLQTTSPRWSAPSPPFIPPDTCGKHAVFADIDGDGGVDFICVITGYNTGLPPAVFINDGSGGLSQSSMNHWLGHTSNVWSRGVIVVFDIDNDGDLDLMGDIPNDVEVWVNDGLGIFTKRKPSGLQSAAAYDMCVGDVDGDGDIDLFIANQNGVNGFYRNNGAGKFTQMSDLVGAGAAIVTDTDSHTHCAIGDINGDGALDLILVGSPRPNNIQIWKQGDAGPRMSAVTAPESVQGSTYFQQAAFGDADGDGDADLVITTMAGGGGGFSGGSELYLNDGAGKFTLLEGSPVNVLEEDGFMSTAIVWGDVDGDGDADLFVSHALQGFKAPGFLVFYRNADGLATFVNATSEAGVAADTFVTSSLVNVLALGDIDVRAATHTTHLSTCIKPRVYCCMRACDAPPRSSMHALREPLLPYAYRDCRSCPSRRRTERERERLRACAHVHPHIG